MLNSRCVWICLIAAWKHKFQTNNKWMFKKDERTYRRPFIHRLAFLTERLLNQPAGVSNAVWLMFSSILFTVMFKKPYSLYSNLYESCLGHFILWEIFLRNPLNHRQIWSCKNPDLFPGSRLWTEGYAVSLVLILTLLLGLISCLHVSLRYSDQLLCSD